MKKIIIFMIATFVVISTAYAALTVGNIPYVTKAGNNPTLSNSPMTVVGSNIGVGVATPSQKLDVNGNIKMNGIRIGTSTTSGYVLTADSAGMGTWQQPTGGGGGGYGTVSTGTVGKLAVYTGTTTVGSGIILDNGTNVGIGVGTPAQKLDVDGAVKATTFIGTSTGASSTSGNLTIGGSALIPSIKATSGTRYLCIDSNGLVTSSVSACSGT